jgi:hypothetical protein
MLNLRRFASITPYTFATEKVKLKTEYRKLWEICRP